VLQFNNETPLTVDAGTSNIVGFILGAIPTSVFHSNIQVKEVIIYNAAHDAATRAKVIAYLSNL